MTTAATTAARLYERAQALEIVDEWIEENAEAIAAAGGEMPPELLALYELAMAEFGGKAEAVALYILEQEANAELVRDEERRLCQRRKVLEAKAARTKQYLKSWMKATGQRKVEGERVALFLKAAPPAIACPDPAKVWEREKLGPLFVSKTIRTVVEYGLNREAILIAWKKGEIDLPEGITVTQGVALTIK